MTKRKYENFVDLTNDDEEDPKFFKKKRIGRYFLLSNSGEKFDYCYEFDTLHPLFIKVLIAIMTKDLNRKSFFFEYESEITLYNLMTDPLDIDVIDTSIYFNQIHPSIKDNIKNCLEVENLQVDEFFGLLKEKFQWSLEMNNLVVKNNVIYLKSY